MEMSTSSIRSQPYLELPILIQFKYPLNEQLRCLIEAVSVLCHPDAQVCLGRVIRLGDWVHSVYSVFTNNILLTSSFKKRIDVESMSLC